MTHSDKRAYELRFFIDQLVDRFMIIEGECLKTFGDLSFPELKAISFLGKSGPSIMRRLAQYLGLSASTVTGIVDKLVRKELVQREYLPEDRRVVRVSLTPRGQGIYDRDHEAHLGFSRGILAALSDDEQEILMVLMRKVSRKIQEAEMAGRSLCA